MFRITAPWSQEVRGPQGLLGLVNVGRVRGEKVAFYVFHNNETNVR